MRHIGTTAAAAALILTLTACNPFTKVTDDQAAARKLEGTWQVLMVDGKKLEGERKPELVFDTAKNAVSGFDGCNRINGTFGFDNGLLKAKTASTRMACLNDEARQASAAIAELFANGGQAVEMTMFGAHVVMIKNAKAEIRLGKTK